MAQIFDFSKETATPVTSKPGFLRNRVSYVVLILTLVMGAAGCRGPVARFTDLALMDIDGRPVKLDDFKGHPILLNFWGTWCVPCKKEIPDLVALNEKYKEQGLVIIGVAVLNEARAVREYAEMHHMTYPLLLGDEHDDFIEAYQANMGVPTSWFIHKDGTLGTKRLGIGSYDFFDAEIRKIL